MQAVVDEVLGLYELCAQNNLRKGIKTPVRHIPVSEGPLKHLVIDFVDIIKPVQGKQYMLFIVDCFSLWVESTPLKNLVVNTCEIANQESNS